jgi:hypothetical protein
MIALKAYFIQNIDNEIIFNSNSSKNYISFVKEIAKENNDSETFFDDTTEKADKYILDFCPKLTIG